MKKLWTPELRRVYSRFPTIIRSKAWDAVVERVKSGDQQGALDIARVHEKRSRQITAQNVVARRIRIQRVKLFQAQDEAADDVRSAFKVIGRSLASEIADESERGLAGMKDMRKSVAGAMLSLRRNLNAILTDLIWKSVLLGVRNVEAAMHPILKANQESIGREDVTLIEDRLNFDMNAANKKAAIKRGSSAWDKATDKVYADVVKRGLDGQSLSERIWDMTKRAELDLNRKIAQRLAQGGTAREIARDIQDYLDPSIGEGEVGGPGIYRSPFKNAMRLARTESGRAYTTAQASWAKSREWVKGIMITLSPAHDGGSDGDVCDERAGEILSPDEFAEQVPLHPHCMCFGTIVIKDEYLTSDAEVD